MLVKLDHLPRDRSSTTRKLRQHRIRKTMATSISPVKLHERLALPRVPNNPPPQKRNEGLLLDGLLSISKDLIQFCFREIIAQNAWRAPSRTANVWEIHRCCFQGIRNRGCLHPIFFRSGCLGVVFSGFRCMAVDDYENICNCIVSIRSAIYPLQFHEG